MSKKCYFVLYFGLVMACFTGAEIGSQFEKRRSPPRDGYAFNPVYCPVRPEVNSFLRQLRVRRLTRAISDQESLRISRSGNANTKWPYNCLHAGTNFRLRIFEMPIYECCLKCEFPGFAQCLVNYDDNGDVQSKCNSEALRCIAQCILKNRPIKKCSASKPRPSTCGTPVKKVGNSYCLQRSCINF